MRGAVAGAAAGLALGAGEALVAAARAQSPTGPGAVAATALYGLPAALAGAALALAAALLGRVRTAPSDPMRGPARSLALLVVLAVAMALLFRLAHHCATAYRNASLAALAFAVVALGLLVA